MKNLKVILGMATRALIGGALTVTVSTAVSALQNTEIRVTLSGFVTKKIEISVKDNSNHQDDLSVTVDKTETLMYKADEVFYAGAVM